MTIIASVKVRDGIVLATDSMSQIVLRDEAGKIQVIKAYSNARKLFRVRDLPIGVMSYGLGSIGMRSVESLVLEFGRSLSKYGKAPWTVKAVSSALHTFVKGVYEESFSGLTAKQRREHLRLGFVIGGYSPKKFLANIWEFELPADEDVKEVRKEESLGVCWRGIPVPFARLFNGFDPRIRAALRGAGVTEEVIKDKLDVKKWRMQVNYDGMPVQDAINFAVYILETTIGASTFELGAAPSCGGPLQVAVILPGAGWQWVREPKLAV